MSENQDIESGAEYLGQQQGQHYQQIRRHDAEQNSRTSRIRAGRYEGTRTTRSREKRVVVINIIQTVAIIFAILIAENGINGHEMYTWSHQMITDGWIIWP